MILNQKMKKTHLFAFMVNAKLSVLIVAVQECVFMLKEKRNVKNVMVPLSASTVEDVLTARNAEAHLFVNMANRSPYVENVEALCYAFTGNISKITNNIT